MEIKPLMRLWNMTGIGLIVKRSSGVLYTNQTGGYVCLQPMEEGVFVPLTQTLEGRAIEPERLLYEYFTGPKWRGHCANGIDDETADFIDDVLSKTVDTAFITVDRSRLKDSHEAWVHVDVASQPDEPPSTYDGSTG